MMALGDIPVLVQKKRLPAIAGWLFFSFLLFVIPAPEVEPARAYTEPYFHSLGDFSILGFSPLGESMISLLFWGFWQSVFIALCGRGLAVLFSFSGVALVHLGGIWAERAVHRFAEAFMTIPSLLLALSLGFVWGEGTVAMILVIAVSEWAFNQKWILGRLKEYGRFTFITVSVAMGAGKAHLLRQLWPFLRMDLLFLYFVYLPGSLLTVAALEFLGLSMGSRFSGLGFIVASNKDLIFLYPHVVIPPMLLITLAIFAALWLKNKVSRKSDRGNVSI